MKAILFCSLIILSSLLITFSNCKRELQQYQTTVRDCSSCINSGKKFCPTSTYNGGNCCSMDSNTCQLYDFCSNWVSNTSYAKYYSCPIQSKCNTTSKELLAKTTEVSVNLDLTKGSFINGDICSYQFYAQNYKGADQIVVTITRLQGAYLYIYFGGYGIGSSTKTVTLQNPIVQAANNKSYYFQADQRVFVVVMPYRELNASFTILYRLQTTPTDSYTPPPPASNNTNKTNSTIAVQQAQTTSDNGYIQTIIISVIVSAFGLLFIIAMIFFCKCVVFKKKVVKINQAVNITNNAENSYFFRKKQELILKHRENTQLRKDILSGRNILDDLKNETERMSSVSQRRNTELNLLKILDGEDVTPPGKTSFGKERRSTVVEETKHHYQSNAKLLSIMTKETSNQMNGDESPTSQDEDSKKKKKIQSDSEENKSNREYRDQNEDFHEPNDNEYESRTPSILPPINNNRSPVFIPPQVNEIFIGATDDIDNNTVGMMSKKKKKKKKAKQLRIFSQQNDEDFIMPRMDKDVPQDDDQNNNDDDNDNGPHRNIDIL